MATLKGIILPSQMEYVLSLYPYENITKTCLIKYTEILLIKKKWKFTDKKF